MKIVLQRVREASVIVREKEVASVKKGLLLLVGIDENDIEETLQQATEKVLKLRIFEDENGKMNRSVLDVKGEVLLIPNFTLCADTEKGNRPSFAKAAPPADAKVLFEKLAACFDEKIATQTGIFGAHMEVKLLNDGPVTFTFKI